MRTFKDLSFNPAETNQVQVGMTVACYNKGGGKVVLAGQPRCSCDRTRAIVLLKSLTDPGAAFCCESVIKAYQLPEVKRRSLRSQRQFL